VPCDDRGNDGSTNKRLIAGLPIDYARLKRLGRQSRIRHWFNKTDQQRKLIPSRPIMNCAALQSLARKMQRRPAEILRRSFAEWRSSARRERRVLEKSAPSPLTKTQRAIAAIRAP